MNHLRVVLFTHPHCGLCFPVKDMIKTLKVANPPISDPNTDVSQSSPSFYTNPFLYHEVNIWAPGNEKWNSRYGLKIPVLHFYRFAKDAAVNARSSETRKLEPLEKFFWNDDVWTDTWTRTDGRTQWTKEVFNAIDFDKKEMRFKHPGDMAKWIWGE